MTEYVYQIRYLGETLDELFTRDEATTAKSNLVKDIMNDKVPMLLTHDDFEDWQDCWDQMKIVKMEVHINGAVSEAD